MAECKHGLKHGCAYCHGRAESRPASGKTKRRTPGTRLSEQMNDRMTALKRRLRELRGE
jgi:histone acetyltransferase (RNA polymerase elongator complex component)